MTNYFKDAKGKLHILSEPVEDKNGDFIYSVSKGPRIITSQEWVDDMCNEIANSGCYFDTAYNVINDRYTGEFSLEMMSPAEVNECLAYFNELRAATSNEYDPWYSEDGAPITEDDIEILL